MTSVKIEKDKSTTDDDSECDSKSSGKVKQKKRKIYASKHNKNALKEQDREHKCHICGKEFAKNIFVIHHIRYKHGEKKHVCSVCNKSFTMKGNLKKHFRRHTGERPFKCEICDRKFAESYSLNSHIKIHLLNGETEKRTSVDPNDLHVVRPKHIQVSEPCALSDGPGNKKSGSVQFVYKFI